MNLISFKTLSRAGIAVFSYGVCYAISPELEMSAAAPETGTFSMFVTGAMLLMASIVKIRRAPQKEQGK